MSHDRNRCRESETFLIRALAVVAVIGTYAVGSIGTHVLSVSGFPVWCPGHERDPRGCLSQKVAPSAMAPSPMASLGPCAPAQVAAAVVTVGLARVQLVTA